MSPDDFTDDEAQEFLQEFGVEIGLFREPFQTFDLMRLAVRVRGRKVVFGLEPAYGLGLFEPFMILAMGGIVLVIVLAILMPIFEMNQLVK